MKPNKENGTIKRDYEYKRLGTVSLLDERYAAGDTIQIILDNHSVHTSKKVKHFLSAMPGRFVFVFTPNHGSWLNMIEGLFEKMTRQMLKGIQVSSKQELVNRIYQYFDEINEIPMVYHWKYHMDEF
ncbi:MAG: transposase [Lachnospiraceae bacterium]|nr:transposase [Lachnospiraceae bacterium]